MTMAQTSDAPAGNQTGNQAGLPRLLPLVPGVPEDLRAHLARYGRPPYQAGRGQLINAVEQSGLTGRGGAAFPVHRKLALVAADRALADARVSPPDMPEFGMGVVTASSCGGRCIFASAAAENTSSAAINTYATQRCATWIKS